MLKKIRVGLSLIVFSTITFYFLDFADLLPKQFHVFAQFQFVPALIAFSVVALTVIGGITLLFGRVYCSLLCPLGIFQDFADWAAKKFHRKKKYPLLKERPLLRWSIVVLTLVAFLGGASFLVSLIDPYSAYGRIATTIFKPVYLGFNNGIAWIDNHYGDYRFYPVDVFITATIALIVASLTMTIIGFIAYKWGRLYCNTICPVGTVLGFISRFSIFKIRIIAENCNSCGLCSMRCKSSCIDSKNQSIDYSRCVNCFNCLEECNRNAMRYDFAVAPRKGVDSPAGSQPFTSSRRRFFAFVVMGLAGIQKLFAKDPRDTTKMVKEIYTSHNIAYKRTQPITPPGAVDVKRFNTRCTACHLCVSKCPSNVLKPTFLEYGLAGMLQPTLEFQHGYCNYHCTVCADVCPSNALEKISPKEKKTLQIGHVYYIKENCVVVTDGTDCGACSEHCPTQAVSMKPYKGDLRIPVIDQNLCVGCGGCEYICPTRPYRAIYVVGNPVHKQALIPEESDKKKIEVNDFGF
ncbi:MAG TPA: 4Fe-4S dicluster domain-containing protein [Chitinophagaceae bacterium]|nr:4Fe-4S dicluster domain-containing protein [Chitinophagaceae bacterium]